MGELLTFNGMWKIKCFFILASICWIVIALLVFHYSNTYVSVEQYRTVKHEFNDTQLTEEGLVRHVNMLTPGDLHASDKLPTSEESIAKNYYITQHDYLHRFQNQYFNDIKDQFWQLPVYIFATETCRRTNCKTIIDIGCGLATKLNAMPNDVKKIGVDYGNNLRTASEKYPHISFIEADLSGNPSIKCDLNISSDILQDAVILSADVIEHIPNPFLCYLPLLSRLAQQANAVILSTPDRQVLYRTEEHPRSPPENLAHVREWILSEVEQMMLDYNMWPVVSARVCGSPGLCVKQGFKEKDDKHQTIMVVNVDLQKVLQQMSQPPPVTVFLVVQPQIHQSLLSLVVDYYISQKVNLHIVNVAASTNTIPGVKQHILSDVTTIKDIINDVTYNISEGEWLMVVDANEVVLPRGRHMVNMTLPQCLAMCGDYTAIGTTTLYAHAPDGSRWSDIPFKMHLPNGWDARKMKPLFNPLEVGVKIWRHQPSQQINLTFTTVPTGQKMVKDITFTGRRVYPFSLTSIRYSPNESKAELPNVLTPQLEEMYGSHIAIGFMSKKRSQVIEQGFLY